MGTADIPEKALAEAWRHLRLQSAVSPGAPGLQVIFPGKPNQDAGPDFLEAMVLGAGGRVVTGDAEIDISPDLWRQHGHHRNPRYRDVSFHVVLGGNRSLPPAPARMTRIAVNPRPPAAAAATPAPCPAVSASSPQSLARLIVWAGESRFRAKADVFARALRRTSPGQALYQGLMESLGYSHNRDPFHCLAALLPLRRLNVLSHRALSFQALLLGSAGLLPSQAVSTATSAVPGTAPGSEVASLEKEWLAWGRPALLGRWQWRFFKVRPANSPPRRLAAAAHLLQTSWLPDPANRLSSLLEAPAALEKSLAAPSYGYWKDHMDFAVPAPVTTSLLGAGRRCEMIVNIVLPFFYAWGAFGGWGRVRSLALDMYAAWAGGEDNLPLRFMKARLAGIEFDHKACQQQGLLHLFHSYCRNGQCRLCPLLRGARLNAGSQ